VYEHVTVIFRRAISRRTVQSLMLALRAIVAADGQQPLPSSRVHAAALGGMLSRAALLECVSGR